MPGGPPRGCSLARLAPLVTSPPQGSLFEGKPSKSGPGWKEPPAASWEFSSGGCQLKGLLFFTCLHVLKNTTGPCFQMSPHSCASLHLCVDLGGTPGRCRRAGGAWSCRPATRWLITRSARLARQPGPLPSSSITRGYRVQLGCGLTSCPGCISNRANILKLFLPETKACLTILGSCHTPFSQPWPPLRSLKSFHNDTLAIKGHGDD